MDLNHDSASPVANPALHSSQKDAFKPSLQPSALKESPTSELGRPKRLFTEPVDPGPSKRARVEPALSRVQTNYFPRPSIEQQTPHPAHPYQHPRDFQSGYVSQPCELQANWAQGGSMRQTPLTTDPYLYPRDSHRGYMPQSYGPQPDWTPSRSEQQGPQSNLYQHPREFQNGYVIRPCGRQVPWARGGNNQYGVASRGVLETPRTRKSFRDLSVPGNPRSHQTAGNGLDNPYSARQAQVLQPPARKKPTYGSRHISYLEELLESFTDLSENLERHIEKYERSSTPSELLNRLEEEFGWLHLYGAEDYPRVYHLVGELREELKEIAERDQALLA